MERGSIIVCLAASMFVSGFVDRGSTLNAINRTAKKLLLSSRLPPFYFLESLSQLLRLGEYLRSSGLRQSPWFSDRYLLFDHINRHVVRSEAIDYLEFGVFKGVSIRRWAQINTNADSRFFRV
jgi:hypothetical protein